MVWMWSSQLSLKKFIIGGVDMLEIGTKAPAFTLPDQNGEMHSLVDYKGERE